jgi:hypothetical protein
MVADAMGRWAQLGHVATPMSLLALANCRQPQVTARHATLCLSIEGRPEDRAAKPGVRGRAWRALPDRGLGLAGMLGRVTDSTV